LKKIYLDTNIFLKLFEKEESGKEKAERIILLAKRNKAIVAISQGVINESFAAVERKVIDSKITDRDASKIVTGIADMIEGKIEQINLSLYPIMTFLVSSISSIMSLKLLFS
jgi:predicted nucleic acid-binding protein